MRTWRGCSWRGWGARELVADPAMPSRGALKYWRATQGEFAVAMGRLVAVHRAERNRRNVPRRPPLAVWDEDLGDRALLWIGRGHPQTRLQAIDPALPSLRALAAWREADPDFDLGVRVNLRMGRLARLKARRTAALGPLLDGIIRGGSLVSLGGTNGLVSTGRLYAWVRQDRAFAAAVDQAYADRDSDLADAALAWAEAAGPGVSAAEMRRRLAPALALGRPGRRRRAPLRHPAAR